MKDLNDNTQSSRELPFSFEVRCRAGGEVGRRVGGMLASQRLPLPLSQELAGVHIILFHVIKSKNNCDVVSYHVSLISPGDWAPRAPLCPGRPA